MIAQMTDQRKKIRISTKQHRDAVFLDVMQCVNRYLDIHVPFFNHRFAFRADNPYALQFFFDNREAKTLF